MQRTITLEGIDKAYPYRRLAEQRVICDTVGTQKIVVLYSPGTASALDGSSIARSRDVGATGVFLPPVAHGDHFAFAWLVFKPQTQIYER